MPSHCVGKRLLPLLAVCALVFTARPITAEASGKISAYPSAVTLIEGNLQQVQLELDAPIICPQQAPLCDVELSFSSSDPARVQVSPIPVVWLYNQWASLRQLTITATANNVWDSGEQVTLSATAVSASIYYNGFSVTVPVTVSNVDPPPPSPGISDQSANVTSDGGSSSIDVLSSVSNSPDSSSLAIVSGPSHGAASVTTPRIVYTPTTDYAGTDSLTYRVCSSIDPAVCATATLNYSVGGGGVPVPNTGGTQPL